MTGGDQALNFIYLIGILVLVGSALLVRRIPLAHGLKMALGWVLIFAAAFALFALKDDFLSLGRRLAGERGEGRVVENGGQTRIKRSLDGHFWADASVNGAPVHFLIDSGATTTTLSRASAASAHVVADNAIPVLVDTANGVVRAETATAGRLRLGTVERRNFAVLISPVDATDVLGMNFLSSLSSWHVEGTWLVMTP